jgi:hypothetical protein
MKIGLVGFTEMPSGPEIHHGKLKPSAIHGETARNP